MQILYEDAHLLFLDKPAGVVVQRGYDAEEPVLFEEVRFCCSASTAGRPA
ncbi:MAG: hypothetical protein ACYC9N_22135 [Thermoanaerobaculia bacterium]